MSKIHYFICSFTHFSQREQLLYLKMWEWLLYTMYLECVLVTKKLLYQHICLLSHAYGKRNFLSVLVLFSLWITKYFVVWRYLLMTYSSHPLKRLSAGTMLCLQDKLTWQIHRIYLMQCSILSFVCLCLR